MSGDEGETGISYLDQQKEITAVTLRDFETSSCCYCLTCPQSKLDTYGIPFFSWRNWRTWDPDWVFAYPSNKVVVMQDRYLGCIYYFFVSFAIFYVFIFSGGYIDVGMYRLPTYNDYEMPVGHFHIEPYDYRVIPSNGFPYCEGNNQSSTQFENFTQYNCYQAPNYRVFQGRSNFFAVTLAMNRTLKVIPTLTAGSIYDRNDQGTVVKNTSYTQGVEAFQLGLRHSFDVPLFVSEDEPHVSKNQFAYYQNELDGKLLTEAPLPYQQTNKIADDDVYLSFNESFIDVVTIGDLLHAAGINLNDPCSDPQKAALGITKRACGLALLLEVQYRQQDYIYHMFNLFGYDNNGKNQDADNFEYTFNVREIEHEITETQNATSGEITRKGQSDSYVESRISFISTEQILMEDEVQLQIYVITSGRVGKLSLNMLFLSFVFFTIVVNFFGSIVEFLMLFETDVSCFGYKIGTFRFFRFAELYYRTKYDKTPNLTELNKVKHTQSELETILGAAEKLGGDAVTKLRREMTAVEWNVEELRSYTVNLCDTITYALDHIGTTGEQVEEVPAELVDKAIEDFVQYQNEKKARETQRTSRVSMMNMLEDSSDNGPIPKDIFYFIELMPDVLDVLRRPSKTVVFKPPAGLQWSDRAKIFAFKMCNGVNRTPWRFRPLRNGNGEVECKVPVPIAKIDLMNERLAQESTAEDGFAPASKFEIVGCLRALLITMKKIKDKVDPDDTGILTFRHFADMMGKRVSVDHMRNMYKGVEEVSKEVDTKIIEGVSLRLIYRKMIEYALERESSSEHKAFRFAIDKIIVEGKATANTVQEKKQTKKAKQEESFEERAASSVKILRGPIILQAEYKRVKEKLFDGAIFEYTNEEDDRTIRIQKIMQYKPYNSDRDVMEIESVNWTIMDMPTSTHLLFAKGNKRDINPPEDGWKYSLSGKDWYMEHAQPGDGIQFRHKVKYDGGDEDYEEEESEEEEEEEGVYPSIYLKHISRKKQGKKSKKTQEQLMIEDDESIVSLAASRLSEKHGYHISAHSERTWGLGKAQEDDD